jgi:hypothetical protein
MAWEQEAQVILMLTTFTGSDNREELRCPQYIPEAVHETVVFGMFRVTLASRVQYEGFLENVVTVTHVGLGQTHTIHHLQASPHVQLVDVYFLFYFFRVMSPILLIMQFESWPDFGVPTEMAHAVGFLNKVLFLRCNAHLS